MAHAKRKAYMDQEYWGRPVPGFGDPQARVLVVGLAPGAHGSNRTGRQFTGDASGDFLFPALFRAGFASQPEAVSRDDGLTLADMYITASARCAPPQNKPTSQELDNCQPFLQREIEILAVGPDSSASFANYWRENNLPFVGLPDPEHRVAKRYKQEVNLFKLGRMPMNSILDREGRLRFVHYGLGMSDIPDNEIFLRVIGEIETPSE